MRLFSFVLAILIAVFCNCVPATGTGFSFVCNESINDPAPVVNETAYAYDVLITIDGKNETIEAFELYNIANDTIILRVHYADAMNSSNWISETIHHDFEYNQTFEINSDLKTCTVSDLLHNETYSLFGMGIENGFKNPEFSYRWNGDYNYTKGNDTVVNGVNADVYSTCLTFNNSQIKYDVDLYFSNADWNVRSGENTPLMVVLKVNQTQDGGDSFTEEKYTYTFSSYHQDLSHFHRHPASMGFIPNDLICPGRKDALEFPELTNNFVVTEEYIIPKHKKILSGKRYYDYENKLNRFDFVAPKNSSSPLAPKLYHHPYSIIHDFHAGVEYMIDRELGNCTISPITDAHIWDKYDVEADPTHPGYFRMRNLVEYNKQMNLTYTGRHVSPRNQLELDTWTAAVPVTGNGTNGSYEVWETYTYTTAEWSTGDISPVPFSLELNIIKKHFNGTVTRTKMNSHFTSVLPLEHVNHEFEVGMCHRDDARKSIVLKFSSQYNEYIGPYSTKIDILLQQAVAKAANVSKIRVSSYVSKELGTDASVDGSAQELFFSIALFDRLGFHANTSEYTSGINLMTAVENLKKVVQNNQLQINLQLHSDDPPITMTAYPNYFEERSSLYAPPPPPVPADTSNGLSNGAVAAISISMVVLGFIIGGVIVHIRYKRGNRQFGYGIQD